MFYQNKFFKYPLLAGFGALMTLAYPPYSHVFMLLFSLSVAFFYLNRTQKSFSALVDFFIFGGAFGLFSTSWITNSLLISGSSRFGVAAIFIYLAMILIFGSFFAIPAFIAVKLRPSGFSRLVCYAGVFVLGEWVRSWLFTGFPWNLIGNVWTPFPPMIQITSMIGTYGLSLLTLVAFGGLACAPKIKPVLLSACLLGGTFFYGYWRLYNAIEADVLGVRVRLVQPNTPQSYKWDDTKEDENLDKLIRLSSENNKDITHVIWPETAVSFYIEIDEVRRGRFISAVNPGGILITGGLRIADFINDRAITSNSIFVINGDTARIVDFYDKKHLVPFGEYIPRPFKIFPFMSAIVPVPPSGFYTETKKRAVFVPKAPPAAMAVCYEVIFPDEILPKERPGWIVVATNDAWYGISHGPYQHFSMAQLRAVETGLPVARASNNGISGMIDPYGRILGSLGLGGTGYLDTPLPVALPETLYARYGVKIPLALALFVIFISFFSKKEKKL